jgi:hypothetical protein
MQHHFRYRELGTGAVGIISLGRVLWQCQDPPLLDSGISTLGIAFRKIV